MHKNFPLLNLCSSINSGIITEHSTVHVRYIHFLAINGALWLKRAASMDTPWPEPLCNLTELQAVSECDFTKTEAGTSEHSRVHVVTTSFGFRLLFEDLEDDVLEHAAVVSTIKVCTVYRQFQRRHIQSHLLLTAPPFNPKMLCADRQLPTFAPASWQVRSLMQRS